METATIHPAIEVSVGTSPAASGVSVTHGLDGSFANHLQRAMETSQDGPSGLKPAGPDGGSVKQPLGMPNGKNIHSTKAAAPTGAIVASPILFASANESAADPAGAATPAGSPATPSVASMALSWLTAMLPDLLNIKPANQGTTEAGADSSATTTHQQKTSQTADQPEEDQSPVSTLSREAATTANHPGAAQVLTAPSTPAAADAPGESLSAEAGAILDQRGGKIQGVTQSAESAALSVLAKTTTAGAGAIPSVIDSMTSAVSAVMAGAGKASAAATAAHSQAAATSQPPAKDTTAASTSLTQSVATSTGSQGVKAVNGISSDARNSGSQDGQPKGNGSPAPPGANAAAQAGTAAPVTNAAQTAANGFQVALSQSTATGSGQAHASTPSQGGAPQTTTGEKIAVAMETPAGLPQTTVSAASLLQSQARSEMRVAVQTESMGAVELHAVLASGKLGASISVVSHEAHTLLNNELPALQQVLTDQNLRIDHLSVINAPMSSGTGAGDGRGFHSGDYTRPQQGRDLRWYSAATPVARSADEVVVPGSARRLSVRA